MITPSERERVLALAHGCHDYGGGYKDKREAEIYHHGIQTVVNVLTKWAEGDDSLQLRVVESVGRNAIRAQVSPDALICDNIDGQVTENT